MRNSAWLLDVIWSKHGIATKDVSVNNKFSQNTARNLRKNTDMATSLFVLLPHLCLACTLL